jgi:hypothetical protein
MYIDGDDLRFADGLALLDQPKALEAHALGVENRRHRSSQS